MEAIMKKLTIMILLLLGASAYIHPQNQFKKIFIPDMYQMSKLSIIIHYPDIYQIKVTIQT